MPIPFILGAIAVVAGVGGVTAGVKGAMDMSDAKDTLNKAKKRDEENQKRHKSIDEQACKSMDELGQLEMSILSSFKTFADVAEKIKNRPSFADIKNGGVSIPKVNLNELKKAYVGAGVLLGGLGGAALGTAGAFAASGATTAAVMALGTASTGAAISSLSGAAATNATLAALGGGSLAAGGGGMALGSAVLGGATLGVGLLVGGVIFSLVGSNLSEKADKAYAQMLENEKLINKICAYLVSLNTAAVNYKADLNKANELYKYHFTIMQYIVNTNQGSDGKVDWLQLRQHEKTTINNVVMLVGLMYHMCKVKLVKKTAGGDQVNAVNTEDINEARAKCKEILMAIDPDITVNSHCTPHETAHHGTKRTTQYTLYQVENIVKGIIVKELHEGKKPDYIYNSHYFANLGIHVGSICAKLENAFGIRISADEVRRIAKVEDAVQVVMNNLS